LIAAVITAAVLRHTLHIHAGFTRQEIAVLALAALVAVLLIQRRRRD
jgi:MYXO-CTERM domain-containing protein